MKVFLQVAFPQRSQTSLKHFSFQTVAPCPQAQPSSSLSWKKKSHYKSQKDFRLLSTHENLISGTSYGTWTMVQLEIEFRGAQGFSFVDETAAAAAAALDFLTPLTLEEPVLRTMNP